MPTIYNTNFNIVVSLLGGWLSLFGLVSYLCKEKFYLSEACKLLFNSRPKPRKGWPAAISCHRLDFLGLCLV